VGALVLGALGLPGLAAADPSQRVYLDEDGRLRSLADADTNRIPDFSNAGYEGGGVALPDVAAVEWVAPIAGDNTAHLQAAIDAVAALPLGPDGFRGAVVLEPGRYEISGSLQVNADGVVLRGAGRGADLSQNTAIVRVGLNEDPVIVVGGGTNNRWKPELPDSRSDIVSSYVQVGSKAFEIADPEAFAVGDNIVVFHPCTEAWLAAVDYGATDTEPPWSPGSRPLVFNRVITKIDGSMVHIDAPIFNDLVRNLAQSYIYKLDRTGIVTQVGVEDLRVEIDSEVVMHAVSFTQVEDGWARNLTVRDFLLGGIHMATAKHLTIADVRAVDPKGPTIGGRKYNFMAAAAQLVLVNDGYARGGRHSFASNGTSWDSGVVFLRGTAAASLAPSEGHHRWSMGLLYDGHTEVDVVYNGVLLGLYNRGSYGTGHGWSAAHSVAWNCDLAGGRGVVQKPPTAQNYAIGCAGQINGNGPFAHPTGYIEGTGQSIEPLSLYEAQLADRLQNPGWDGEPPAGYGLAEVQAEADAFVRAGAYSSENYGADPGLTVKGGNPDFTREAYLRFAVDEVEEFTAVSLRLRQAGLGFGGMRYAIATTDPAWDEATITYDTRPASAEAFGYWFPEQADDSLIDVTAEAQAALAAGEPLSVRIWATDYFGAPAQTRFGSREGDAALAPVLVFTVPDPDEPPTGDDGGEGADEGGDGDSTDGDSGSGDSGDADSGDGGSETSGAGQLDEASSGCGCRHGEASRGRAWPLLGLLLLPLLRRRRRAA